MAGKLLALVNPVSWDAINGQLPIADFYCGADGVAVLVLLLLELGPMLFPVAEVDVGRSRS